MFRRRDDAATLRLPYRRIRGNGSGSGGWSTTRVVVVTTCVVVVMLTAINLASFVVRCNVASEQRTHNYVCSCICIGSYWRRARAKKLKRSVKRRRRRRRRRRSDAYRLSCSGF